MIKKNRQIVKREDKKPISLARVEKMKKLMPKFALYDLDSEMNKLVEEFDQNKGELTSEFGINVYKTSYAFGLQNHIPITESVNKKYRLFVTEMIKDIISEFDCKLASEVMLAQSIAGAFVRTIQYSNCLSEYFAKDSVEINKDKTDYYRTASKELDRAHRQFVSSLSTLRQMKNPLFEINVKASTAFIGQNQQFNASGSTHKPNEINDPK